jgi:hypothetical protein
MPRSVTPVGEHMANLRRKDGLGKNPQRAATRAAQLAAIGPDWNCPWPLDWQRHYRVLAELAADEPGGHLPDIAPASSTRATTSANGSSGNAAAGRNSPRNSSSG